MSGPLSHIKVLDLTRVMAGPWATQLLADLGADVIKVERPGVGDDTRAWGPPFVTGADGRQGDAGYFLAANRGKRSIVADLASPDGQDVVRALALRSDIVMENFRVGTLARYGLGASDLRALNPRLIYASLTGFGQTGPRRAEPAYDFMIQAMGGLMSVTGERDDRPGGGPQKVGLPMVDLMSGMYLAVGVLAALARRGETGTGETIDLALFDVQAAFLSNQAMNFLLTGCAPVRHGNQHPNLQPQDVFACRDGSLAVAVGNDAQFAALSRAIGSPDMARDPRFTGNAARVANLPALTALLADVFLLDDVASWIARLAQAGVPCGPINAIDRVFADKQFGAREMLRHLPHAAAGQVPSVVTPLRFADAPLEFTRGPPVLGEHTEAVLTELGMAPTTD